MMQHSQPSLNPEAVRPAVRRHQALLLAGLLAVLIPLLLLARPEAAPASRLASAHRVAPDVLAVRPAAWVETPVGRVRRAVTVRPAPPVPRRADLREALAADLSVTLTDLVVPVYDADGEGDLDPGERLVYHVEITNSGDAAATGVALDLTTLDAHATFVADSRMTSPVAFDDAYAAIGNVPLVVAAADGVIQGDGTDVDPDEGATLAVAGIAGCADTEAPFDCATAGGGAVSLAADGAFTYTPPAGFEGDDSFTYALSDGTVLPDGALGGPPDGVLDPMPTSGALVTISVAEVIWFVEDGVSGGSGHAHAPLNLDEFNQSALDEAGDFVFVRSGTHVDDSPMVLLDGQKLVGEGVSLAAFFLANQSSHARKWERDHGPGAAADGGRVGRDRRREHGPHERERGDHRDRRDDE